MTPEDLIDRLSGPLSLRRRIATVVAALGGLVVAGAVGLLWATEPGLPPRTHVAFGVIVAIGLAWGGYGGWVLTRRTPLLALDRVIAAWLALAACGLLGGVTATVAVLHGRAEPLAVGVLVLLLGVAGLNLLRARAHRAALLRRRRDLHG